MALRKQKNIIALALYPGVTALEVVGTMETLIGLNLRSPYRLITVGETIEPVPTDTPLSMVPNKTFAQVPTPFGVIIPGSGTPQAEADESLLSWVQLAGSTSEMVASIGTGSLVLAEAGLLPGRSATTHWAHSQALQALGVTYVCRRWVDDGKFLTAAGGTAGLDMALHLMAKLTSEAAARRIQLVVEYDPQPPFGGIDWNAIDTSGNETGVETSVIAMEQAS